MANILLVEPQPEQRKRMVTLLAASGYRVQSCATYAEALDLMVPSVSKFHLVITDLDLGNSEIREGLQLAELAEGFDSAIRPSVLCLSNRLYDPMPQKFAASYGCKAVPMEWLPKVSALLKATIPHELRVRLTHLFSPCPGTACFPEEEPVGLVLAFEQCECRVGLAPRRLLLADFLARYAHKYPMTAAQIAMGMSAGSVFHSSKIGEKEITERAVITGIMRLRDNFQSCIDSWGLPFQASDVISTEPLEEDFDDLSRSSGPGCGYRFRPVVEIIHPQP